MENDLMGLFSRTQEGLVDEPEKEEPETWTVLYTAHLTGGHRLSWEEAFHFDTADRQEAALNHLGWQLQHGTVKANAYYPLHRFLRVTAKIL